MIVDDAVRIERTHFLLLAFATVKYHELGYVQFDLVSHYPDGSCSVTMIKLRTDESTPSSTEPPTQTTISTPVTPLAFHVE